MKKSVKKFFALLLTVVVILTAVPMSGLDFGFALKASAFGSSGSCGNDITYTFNGDTGVLTISGTGEMWNDEIFSCEPSIKSVVIGNGVTSIGDFAFAECSNLTSVTIADSVTSIGILAFVNCTSLTDITMPEGLTRISDEMFWGCSSLTDIVLPDGVTSIDNRAFGDCDNLSGIAIPKSVTYIGERIFASCYSLDNIFYSGTENDWNEIDIDDYERDILSEHYIHYNVSADEIPNHLRTEIICEATCTDEGIKSVSCDCGYSFEVYVPSPGHRKGEIIEIIEPACGSVGCTVYRCSACGEIFEDDYRGSLPHSEDEIIEVIDPTCTEEGYTVYHCNRCGEDFGGDFIEPTGHSFENDVCQNCGYEIKSINPDEIQSVQIDKGDEKLFKFVPSESGEYYYYSFGSYDTIGIIYDEYMNEIGYDDDNGAYNNFNVCCYLEAGKAYYLSVHPWYYLNPDDIISIVISEKNAEEILPNPGSTTVVDNDYMYIYGIKAGLDNWTIEDYLFIPDYSCDYYSMSCKDYIGTGTKLYMGWCDGSKCEYTFILFGDVNGDGWYDGTDAMIVSCLADGLLTESDVSEEEYIAADCNHDGVIDRLDVDILEQAGVYLAQVEQTESGEELLETSSAYAEYLSLIDQTVEADESAEEAEKAVQIDLMQIFIDFIGTLFKLFCRLFTL